MNLFICLFGPSFIGIKLLDYLSHKLSMRYLIIYYGIMLFVLNTIAVLVSYLLMGIDGNICTLIEDSSLFGLKYVLIEVLSILFVVPIIDIINKNIELSFEVVLNEKNK